MQVYIPEAFRDYALRLLGEERYGRLAEALAGPPVVSVRLNPDKARRAGLAPEAAVGYDGLVPWADGLGFYLKERPAFTFDPLLHAGAYYVQEASSMFMGRAFRRYVARPSLVLDLCAAPGGKSTHIRSLLPEGSLLVSNDPVRARAQALVENLAKWGHPDVVVANSYPRDFAALEGLFDVLVADVPCSGEGMFRKEEEAVAGWSMEQVRACRDRQREILRDVWPALKPGGLLVYSTCTLNAYEDEENVAWVARELGAEVLPLETDAAWGVTGNLLSASGDAAGSIPVCHFIQGLARGEGFFLAVLRKEGVADDSSAVWPSSVGGRLGKGGAKKRAASGRPIPALPAACRKWLCGSDAFSFSLEGAECVAVRTAFQPLVELLRRKVKVLQAGVPLAALRGRDWCPHPALALSVALDRSAFPTHPLTYFESVAYLHKEALTLPLSASRGYVLLAYCGLPLGFVKNIGGRANNLYPQEWKIRTSHFTDFSLINPNISAL